VVADERPAERAHDLPGEQQQRERRRGDCGEHRGGEDQYQPGEPARPQRGLAGGEREHRERRPGHRDDHQCGQPVDREPRADAGEERQVDRGPGDRGRDGDREGRRRHDDSHPRRGAVGAPAAERQQPAADERQEHERGEQHGQPRRSAASSVMSTWRRR
jgi:hypothetical protein